MNEPDNGPLSPRTLARRIRPYVEHRLPADHAIRVVSITASCETWVAFHRGLLQALVDHLDRLADLDEAAGR